MKGGTIVQIAFGQLRNIEKKSYNNVSAKKFRAVYKMSSNIHFVYILLCIFHGMVVYMFLNFDFHF